jgi:hypothetical protein
MIRTNFALSSNSQSLKINGTGRENLRRGPLTCVWITTGDPRQPLVCVWRDRSDTGIEPAPAGPGRRYRGLSLVCPKPDESDDYGDGPDAVTARSSVSNDSKLDLRRINKA